MVYGGTRIATYITMPVVDRQTLFFFIFMFIFLLLPNGGDQPHLNKDRETLDLYKSDLRHFKDELQLLTYNLGYGNITGLLLSYQDYQDGKNALLWPIHQYDEAHPWTENEKYSLLPNEVSAKVRDFWGKDPVTTETDSAYLFNISGRAYGDFQAVSSKVKPVPLTLPPFLQEHYALYTQAQYEQDKERYERDPEHNSPPQLPTFPEKQGNITFSEGLFSIIIESLDYNFRNKKTARLIENDEDRVDDAVLVKGRYFIQDYPEVHTSELDFHGVYFQKTGALVTSTRSAKFRGLQGVPHFAMNDDNFVKAKKLVVQYLNTTNVEKDVSMDDLNNNVQLSQGQCEYVLFFQLEKLGLSSSELRDIDEELVNPAGRPISHDIPQIEIKQSLLYSPDCGIVLELKPGAAGNKIEVIHTQIRHIVTGLLVLVVAQLLLFISQVKQLRTPGHLSAVSASSVLILAFQDSLMSWIFLVFAQFVPDLYLLFVSVSVVLIIMYGVLELRFLVTVLTAQANERGTTWWEILRGSTSEPSLPLPVTDRNNATATPAPAPTTAAPVDANDAGRAFNLIVGPGCMLTTVSLLVILSSSQWRVMYRHVFEYVGLMLINLYWLPQFSRNTLKNRRRAFSWSFVIGTSVIHLIPVAYVFLVPSNPLRHRYNARFVGIITSWVALQVFGLYLQDQWGPRFWVNDKWLPKAYDYHYLLKIKDLEHGFSSDILASLLARLSEADAEGIVDCKVDCTICMTEIAVPVNTNANGKPVVIDRQRLKQYMITPCHHVFHSECLEDWMVYKLQCPVCRAGLPPV